ncbi:alpha/beta fold hydrolase [Sandarakinorhabdus oryzae]|uniref:alpha/beta fold hydrolase n=1 Tax=Sandarakinorhabdus oryzae TaxID=2675220 RepID=UPI0018CC72FE|nr:alpha/beta hydrolase [Sandarakinorhabdus oryzae]
MKSILLAICALLALAPACAQAETAAVNGVSLHYSVRGSGEPLLLLHGFGACAADWGELADRLAATHKVIAVDARGHGQSTNPSGVFRHADAAEDIAALLDILGLNQVRAIGFSSGGITLLHLATRHPDRLSKMVIIGATSHFPPPARAIMQSATSANLPPDVVAAYRQCASRGEAQVQSLLGQFRALGASQTDTDFQVADLAKIKAATLIVHGDRDVFFPVSIPVNLYQSISGSALWIVPNGDHSPTAGAEPAAFIDVVARFLSQKPDGR